VVHIHIQGHAISRFCPAGVKDLSHALNVRDMNKHYITAWEYVETLTIQLAWP